MQQKKSNDFLLLAIAVVCLQVLRGKEKSVGGFSVRGLFRGLPAGNVYYV